LEGRKVLYVIMKDGPDRATDDNVVKHLQSMGLVVAIADEKDPPAQAEGRDLVIISSTVISQNVLGKYRTAPMPVIVWEWKLYEDLMGIQEIGLKQYPDKQPCISIVNPSHPMAAGFPAGKLAVFKRPQRDITSGHPLSGATVIATIPDEPDKAVLFCFEKGALMDNKMPAPARRIGLFLYDNTFDELNGEGIKLFDAAVDYALAP
jgi:hypothetical protein